MIKNGLKLESKSTEVYSDRIIDTRIGGHFKGTYKGKRFIPSMKGPTIRLDIGDEEPGIDLIKGWGTLSVP